MVKSATAAVSELLFYLLSFGSFYALLAAAQRWPQLFSSAGPLFRLCVGPLPSDQPSPASERESEPLFTEEGGGRKPSLLAQAVRLCGATLGIQLSYLCWGLMQETIMTTAYSNGELFQSSRFLVFANRIIALLISLPLLFYTHRHTDSKPHSLPLYHYAHCSVSNIVSSACQYEALKFVSFPTQVLAKACKMIPVMLMGYFVSRKKYRPAEYVVAVCVTGGVVLFKLNEANDAPVRGTEAVGILLIVIYMVADSFTSNWQGKLFSEHGVSSLHMMCAVNLFSSSFTAASILVGMEVNYVTTFLTSSPEIVLHIFIMAVCSAVGQLFIFYTIKEFGPLVFATIQTVRQFLSVVLSIVVFSHPINAGECSGIVIVFAALGGQIIWKAHERQRLEQTDAAARAR
ncbi:MAG: hypothetical protein SGPRY_011719 [Prymnesium sp.]